VCANALHTVDYSLRHDGAGSITAVEAAVVLTELAAGSGGGSASLTQHFSVSFVASGAVGVRPLSGAAGYLPSARVLAGVKTQVRVGEREREREGERERQRDREIQRERERERDFPHRCDRRLDASVVGIQGFHGSSKKKQNGTVS
jgi:hypothetical protein